jgi:hypothetical protein
VRNTGTSALSRLRIRLAAPGRSRMPSLAAIEALAAGREARVEMSLPLLDEADAPGPGAEIPAAALVTWERGAEGGTFPLRFSLRVAAGTPAEQANRLRNALLASVDPEDLLVNATAAELSAGAEDPLAAAAMALDSLGRLRQSVRAAGSRSAVPGSPAAASPPPPDAIRGARQALRGLSSDPLDWALLTADIVRGLGLSVGILAWPDSAVLLVDTGIPLPDALAGLPALARDAALLRKLSRNGRLCVPLSGDLAPPSSSLTPSAFALVAGMEACRRRGVDSGAVAWLGPPGSAAARPEVAVPFPALFPAVTDRLDRDTLGERIRRTLEQQR